MAISSPLKPKVSTGSVKTVKKFQGILFNRTKVKKEIFQRKTILQNRRVENERRKQLEDELEAPNLVTKPRGPSQLIAGSAKGFFDRLIGFLGYLTAGWIINNLPTWIAMGKEFIARTQQMGKILGNFIVNSTDIFKNFTKLLGATLTNLMEFDFLDTSGRVSTAFDELNLSVENWGAGFEDVIKLITTPLTEGIASGEDARPLGTENTNEGAYERTAPYSGTPAPQVMLQGGISGTTAMLSKGQKGADPYVGFTSGFRTSRRPSHNGIDIGTTGQRGYYVAFLLDGTATLIPNNGKAGNTVEIKSGGTIYKFFHLARFSISSGPYKAGTAIGEIGMTGGNSTGIHLHYEVHPPGTNGVDPTPYVNLIRIGKNLGKPIAAPASVASSSISQPQQNLMGTPSSGGISGRGVDKGVSVAKKLIADLGITPAQAAGIVGNFLYESAGMNPGEREGSPYGTPEKPPALGTVGVGYGWAQWTNSRPGDRLDKFLKSYGGDKGKIATDDDNYRFLMKELKGSESLNRKGVITGTYFPKDDPQAASDWFRRNWERAGVPADEKRRKETLVVFNKIKGLSRNQAKIDVAAAPAQTSSPTPATTQSKPPTPARITPTGTPQNPQIPQSLAQERIGPTVIVSQTPPPPPQQMMYSGGGGSSGGGSSQISDFALLNNFIKNKLLLDLAYL
jgi:murein DD-endopeptidase MepM/ murein hydrolase activator NlpD